MRLGGPAARLAALAAALLPILASCATPQPTQVPSVPRPSPSPIAAASPSVPAGERIPPLLLFVPAGAQPGLWRIDPNVDASTPSWRSRIDAPPGRWRPTAPAPGGLVALTSLGETPVRVALARLDEDRLVPSWETSLPKGAPWTDPAADCVSPGGTVAVSDDGETFYLVDVGRRPLLVPGQTDNLGECTWVDAETLLWDQETRILRAWRRGAATSIETRVKGLDPSYGGSRVAWFEDATQGGDPGTIRVAPVRTTPAGLEVGAELRPLAVGNPGAIALSPDGGWLLVYGIPMERLSIFEVTENGLFTAKAIELASLAGVAGGGSVTWMPSSP